MSAAVLEAGWGCLAVAAALSSGMMLTFSNFVMPAFDRGPHPEAMRAMQRINEDVINPLFLLVFMGTGPLLLVWLGVQALHGPVEARHLGAALLYLVGVVGVTAIGNVPLNHALARLESERAERQAWQGFARPWVRWNHLRTIAAAATALVLLLGR